MKTTTFKQVSRLSLLALAMASAGESVSLQSNICFCANTLRRLGTKVQKKTPIPRPKACCQLTGK